MMTRRKLAQELHRGAGALFGALMFVVLFSGCWSLGHNALVEWTLASPKVGAGPILSIEQLLRHAKAQGVDFDDGATLILPGADHFGAALCNQRQACTLLLHPVSGAPVREVPALSLLKDLHKSLFAGFPGRIAISLFGLALLVLCVAGLWTHSRRWRDFRRFRRDKGLRTSVFDLHSLIGLWAFPWLLLFALTGALSGLGALGTLLLAPQVYPQMPRQVFVDLMGRMPAAGNPSTDGDGKLTLDEILANDQLRTPGFNAQRLTLHRAKSPVRSSDMVELAGVQSGLPSTAVFERHFYRRSDGLWLGDLTSGSHGFWTRAFIAVQPLHFAQYDWLGSSWGSVMRSVQLLMGLAASVLCASGLFLWQRRREKVQRDRGVPWLRVSQGLCVGLVAATAMLLLVMQCAPADWLADQRLNAFFGVCWGAAALTVLVSPSRLHATTSLLTAAGGVTALATVLHGLQWWRQGIWPGWQLDALLFTCGLLLMKPQRWLVQSRGLRESHDSL